MMKLFALSLAIVSGGVTQFVPVRALFWCILQPGGVGHHARTLFQRTHPRSQRARRRAIKPPRPNSDSVPGSGTTAMLTGFCNPVINEGFTGVPSRLYSPIVPLLKSPTKRSFPEIARPAGEYSPV